MKQMGTLLHWGQQEMTAYCVTVHADLFDKKGVWEVFSLVPCSQKEAVLTLEFVPCLGAVSVTVKVETQQR